MRRFYVLLLSLLVGSCTYGQGVMPVPSNQLKLSPFKVADPVNPGIEGSYERHYGERFATQLTYAYLTDPIGVTPYGDFSGHRLGLEQKYLVQAVKHYRTYLSFEVSAARAKYTSVGEFGYRPPAVDTFLYTYFDTISVHKRTTSFNVKAGRQFFFGNLVVDIGLGLGLKHRNVYHRERIASADEMNSPRHPNAYYMADKDGKYFTLNVPLTIRLGYTF